MAQPRRTRTYLEGATYELRERVKRHGGRWDKERKAWYVLGDVPEALCDLIEPGPGQERRFPRSLDLDIADLAQAKSMDGRPSTPARLPAKSTMRPAPIGDAQTDFFVPSIHDVSSKENRSTMDVAIFRLSKKDNRAGAVIRYELPDGHIEVASGPHGMASVWDYDIVLMAISHLTDAMNKYRAGLGEKPSRNFRPHVSEILKFSRKGDGGRQAEAIEAALERLRSTTIKIVRESYNGKGRPLRYVEAEGLISGYKVLSFTDQQKVAGLEIELPQWIYKQIAESRKPDVLTVHPDYFLIDSGLGRFLYRLARQAAGKGQARWYFLTVFERSGSTGKFKEFCRMIRQIIEADDMPEYRITEEKGAEGPMLVMTYRDATKAAIESEPDAGPEADEGASESAGV